MKTTILFVLNKSKTNSKGQSPVSCRITHKNKRKQFSTGLKVCPDNWNNKQQLVEPPEPDSKYINTQLSLIRQNLNQAFLFLQVKTITLKIMRFEKLNITFGNDITSCMPLQIKFQNKNRPELGFDLVKLESLLSKNLEEMFQPHRIEFFHILIITQGQGRHSIDFTDYTYRKGTVLTVRKDQMQRFYKNSSVKGYLLLFTEDFLTSHFGEDEVLRAFLLFNELLNSPKVDMSTKEFEEISKLLEILIAEYNEKNDEFARVIIRSSLHVLLLKLFRFKTKNPDKLLKRTYFNEFLHFQELVELNSTTTRKVLDYAKMMNCTTRTLNNICRSILDKSAKTVINDIVVIQIKRLLTNTKRSVTEIAYESGFNDPTNMYRYFKTNTKRTPESFRKVNN